MARDRGAALVLDRQTGFSLLPNQHTIDHRVRQQWKSSSQREKLDVNVMIWWFGTFTKLLYLLEEEVLLTETTRQWMAIHPIRLIFGFGGNHEEESMAKWTCQVMRWTRSHTLNAVFKKIVKSYAEEEELWINLALIKWSRLLLELLLLVRTHWLTHLWLIDWW